MSERNLNQNRNQIVVKFGSAPKLIKQTLFKNQTRNIMVVTRNQLQKDLETLLLKSISPSNKYAVYFNDIMLEIPFIQCCQKLFTSELVILRVTKLLEDVENPNTQKELILQYHGNNHNGITETVEHLFNKILLASYKRAG